MSTESHYPPASAPKDEIDLSIVLVNYNGDACLPSALRALRDNTAAKSVDCIVVDSGSTDESWEGVERYWNKARVIRYEQNIGFCSGCNRGAESARGELIAFVNFDSTVEDHWDAPLVRTLDDAGISIAGGMLVREDGVTVEAAGLAIAPNTATFGLSENASRESIGSETFEVVAASGALMMVRREEFLRLGGFFEPIWMYGEEADLCLRVAGRVVIDPRSATRHAVGHAAGPPRSPLRLYWPSRNRLINSARHLTTWRIIVAVVSSAAFDLLTLAQVRSWEAARSIARGWRDGLLAMPAERGARTRAERKLASSKLASLREAVAQQRRLGRL